MIATFPDKACADLNGATVAAASIGLSTNGATVLTATAVPVGGDGAGAYGPYCLVSGDIKPVDPYAPAIKFQVALPETWNSKALMLGGSGFDGSIASLSTSDTLFGAQSAPLPLGRGYAVFASDSGHQTEKGQSPAAFGSSNEAVRNFYGDALKKTRDVAVSLITQRYGRAPSKSYFLGYSRGGGEAMTVLQRWPADWDGVIAGAPGWNLAGAALQMLSATQAVTAPGAWLSQNERSLLYKAALANCDTLDGAADGVISNVRKCAVRFDPATAIYNGAPLRCPWGADTGDTCLSNAQIIGLRQINEPTRLSYTLGSGETSLTGFPVYIADNGGGAGNDKTKANISLLGVFGFSPPAFPSTATQASAWQQSDNFIRYLALGDVGYNSLTLNVGTASGLATNLVKISALDADINDVTPFLNRGGKLLLWHGTADMLVSPRATEFLYAKMQAAMGKARVDAFARFYQIPGSQHGYSAVFDPQWDQLTALENWVEKEIDPADNLIVSDDAGVPGRTRPMCRYMTFPRYKGSGDINSASSYNCASS